MKKNVVILWTVLIVCILGIAGCGKDPAESVTVPDTVVEEAVNETPSVSEPITEEPAEESDTEEVIYPYWSELHDYNLDQPVLEADGDIKNLSIQLGNKADELYITWFSKSGSRSIFSPTNA